MNELLIRYAADPKNAELNFELASAYKEVKHYAAACSYYLRCAEWAQLPDDKALVYESLIQIAICFRELGNREWSEEGWLLHAVSLLPDRPEAYWVLSMLYERQKKWQESYMFAVMGLNCPRLSYSTRIDIGFEHAYVLAFQKAVAAWWIGRLQEARSLFLTMPDKYQLSERYIQLVQQNINSIGTGPRSFDMYTRAKHDRFRFKFPGIETIDNNYSQVYQDMFVLSALDGKRNGYYLEIGASDPFHVNNTWLLEQKFEWKGVSIEINEKDVAAWQKNRRNPCICRDATTINYAKFLEGLSAPNDIDYLQIDCEPPSTTFKILTSIPFEQYRFAVITYEHDFCVDASRRYKDLSRKFLKAQGYILAVNNISPDDSNPFEDWWIHPALISSDTFARMRNVSEKVKCAERYMLGG
jgi:hypothetical protein